MWILKDILALGACGRVWPCGRACGRVDWVVVVLTGVVVLTRVWPC